MPGCCERRWRRGEPNMTQRWAWAARIRVSVRQRGFCDGNAARVRGMGWPLRYGLVEVPYLQDAAAAPLCPNGRPGALGPSPPPKLAQRPVRRMAVCEAAEGGTCLRCTRGCSRRCGVPKGARDPWELSARVQRVKQREGSLGCVIAGQGIMQGAAASRSQGRVAGGRMLTGEMG